MALQSSRVKMGGPGAPSDNPVPETPQKETTYLLYRAARLLSILAEFEFRPPFILTLAYTKDSRYQYYMFHPAVFQGFCMHALNLIYRGIIIRGEMVGGDE